MTIQDEFLTGLRAELGRNLAFGIEVGTDGLGLGFFTSTGRQVGVRVQRTLVDGLLEVSDGGASWMDLVTGGYADATPTPTELDKIERLCSMYGVRWGRDLSELTMLAELADFAGAARRIAAVSPPCRWRWTAGGLGTPPFRNCACRPRSRSRTAWRGPPHAPGGASRSISRSTARSIGGGPTSSCRGATLPRPSASCRSIASSAPWSGPSRGTTT